MLRRESTDAGTAVHEDCRDSARIIVRLGGRDGPAHLIARRSRVASMFRHALSSSVRA